MDGPFSARWENLVAETQFATDLILLGINRVCRVPMGPDRLFPVGYDEIHPLYAGLHMFTSGVERLCKLALACHSYVTRGTFDSGKKYSHRIVDLFADIEKLDLTKFERASRELYLDRPIDQYGDELMEWLQAYASGDGRYELLDSLRSENTAPSMWEAWVSFCSYGTVSDQVRESICLHRAVGEALAEITTASDFEVSASPHLEIFTPPLSEKSSAVGIAMYRRARWAAEVLGLVTHYTREELPILREVTYVLTQPSGDFFSYEVAKIDEAELVAEELAHRREESGAWGMEDEEDPFDEE